MAKTILKNVEVKIDGTDLSERISSATIDVSAEEQDVTAFKTEFRQRDRGLKDATMTLAAFQDLEAASLDSVLWPLSDSGDEFRVIIRDLDSPGSDPFAMTGKLFGYQPIAGAVGEPSTTDITIMNTTSYGVTRHAVS